MKLILKNFRSFENYEANLTHNFILISGKTGVGKTSIFMGIMFALYGEGKKIIKHGKKSCYVELHIDRTESEIKNYIIKRTKSPNRLIVIYNNQQYEDKVAQEMINLEFKDTHIGYISQRLYTSFILMSPSEKLNYIEKIIFDRSRIDFLHKKCKEIIYFRKTSLLSIQKENEGIKSVMKELNFSDFSKECISEQEYEEEKNKMKKYKSELKILKEKSEKIKNYEKISYLKDEINILPKKVDLNLLNKIEKLEKKYILWNSYQLELNKLSKLRPQNISKDKLNLMINELLEINKLRNELINYNPVLNRLNELEKIRIENVVKYNCPNCNTDLGLWCDDLIQLRDTKLKYLDYENVKKIEEERIKLLFQKKILDEKRERERELFLNHKTQMKIENNQDGLNLFSVIDLNSLPLEKELEKLQLIKKINKEYENQLIRCENLKCEKPFDNLKELKKKSFEIEKLVIRRNEKEKILNTVEYCEKEEGLEDKINFFENEIISIEKHIQKMDSYFKWYKINSLLKKEDEFLKSYPRALKLQDYIIKAEKIALSEVLLQLNLCIQSYLDKFADNLKINISFEEKINIQIFQREYEIDLGSLSGGELARIILAFTLAFSELLNIKLLLLDESMASLDEETTTLIIDTIRDNFDGKVICIAHQTMKGIFDSVIEL